MLYRTILGHILRLERKKHGLTLRAVSAGASISLGYLSEVERGQKEVSSELLANIAAAIGVPLWSLLEKVAHHMRIA